MRIINQPLIHSSSCQWDNEGGSASLPSNDMNEPNLPRRKSGRLWRLEHHSSLGGSVDVCMYVCMYAVKLVVRDQKEHDCLPIYLPIRHQAAEGALVQEEVVV